MIYVDVGLIIGLQYFAFLPAVSLSPELQNLVKKFKQAAHELLELLDVRSPSVGRLKVMYHLVLYPHTSLHT